MLRGRNNFALNFGLLVSTDLVKQVVPASVLGYVTERGGLLGHGQGCHHLLATSRSVGVQNNWVVKSSLDTTSTLFRTNPNPGQDYLSLSGVLS